MSKPYTLACYRVLPGKEGAFVDVWSKLADTFTELPNPPIWGTLIRSVSDPTVFYSFGPWKDAAHVAEMRSNPEAGAAFRAIRQLCAEMTPGDYEMIRHVQVNGDEQA